MSHPCFIIMSMNQDNRTTKALKQAGQLNQAGCPENKTPNKSRRRHLKTMHCLILPFENLTPDSGSDPPINDNPAGSKRGAARIEITGIAGTASEVNWRLSPQDRLTGKEGVKQARAILAATRKRREIENDRRLKSNLKSLTRISKEQGYMAA